MSNIGIIIPEKAASIGSFMVGRLLPFIDKRHVGPFVFIDHMGPVAISEEQNVDVPPHPHIGLSTLTFLFEGAIMHRDSTGAVAEIKPGAVNWMTAGKGVVHSERRPERLKNKAYTLHGLQIWIALPKELEQIEPSFVHVEESELPTWEQDNLQIKLIAGSAFGKESPVPVYSKLYFIEIKSETTQHVKIGEHLYGESGLYILNGSINAEGTSFGTKQLLVAHDSKLCEFEIEAGTTLYIFGGEELPEPRHINWNFVSSDKETINQAREDWKAQSFPKIPGDDIEFVPLPEYPKK